MNLTDFYFLCAFALGLIVYYVVPKKAQWAVLLCGSIAYYVCNGNALLILYPILSVVICFVMTMIIGKCDETKAKLKFSVLITGVVLLLATLIILKYLRFTSIADLLVPLGLSYYTFTLIGYIVDVYYDMAKPQTNLFKLLSFGLYFPALVSGPIMQYREVQESFFAEHEFSYKNLTRGLQRMLWGFFKKLVIAERLGVIVGTIYGDHVTYGGAYVWFGILAFTLQLYTDFSGLMDIVLGISECFGIVLPENFKTPFFAKTITEYWRRWHITLGVWFKEYVFYRILRTKAYTNLQKKLKDKLGKKKGKQISTFMAMFVLWLIIGLWHGGNITYVIGSGLIQWLYIVLEETCEPFFTNIWKKKGIDINATWLNIIRIVRTFILVNIGNAFFRAASFGDAMQLFKAGITGGSGEKFSTGVLNLGLSWVDYLVLGMSLIILLCVSLSQNGLLFGKKIAKTGEIKVSADTIISMREIISRNPLIVRLLIWFVFFFYVICMGQYGPGYSAAEFIYQGF